jgi:ComB9 competence protein
MERQVSYLTLALVLLLLAQPALAQTPPPFGSSGGGMPDFGDLGNDSGNATPSSVGDTGQRPPMAAAGTDFISQTSNELNAQASGQYPSMQRTGSMPIGAIQRKWSNPKASTGQVAPGIVRFTWRSDFVMPIRTREFMSTTIELPNWENIEKIILGDTMVFESTKIKQNILVVRPTNAGADTNMTVIGVSGNIYNFYLRSEGWNSKDITDLTVYISAAAPGGNIAPSPLANATNAAGMPLATSAGNAENFSIGGNKAPMGAGASPSGGANVPDYVRSVVFKPENLRFDLRIFAPTPADVDIAPLRAFTDGTWTYFDYGEKADTVRRPVVARVIDGVDTMINTRTAGPNGNIIIAEGLGSFTLRNGDRVVCIFESPSMASIYRQHPGMTPAAGAGGMPEMTYPPMGGSAGSMGQISAGVPSQMQSGYISMAAPPPPRVSPMAAGMSHPVPSNRADSWFGSR